MFESMNYIPQFRDTYGSELDAIETAAETARAYVDRETAKLTRADGTAVYAPAEHRERHAAILEAATARYDASVARHIEAADRTVADLERKLALLERDPLDALSDADRARAASMREFIKEDAQRLPASRLADRIRAAVAGDDKVTAILLARYLDDRDDANGTQLRPAVAALRTFLGDEERFEKRRDIEAKLRAARSLPVAVASARRRVDGSDARELAAARQRVATTF